MAKLADLKKTTNLNIIKDISKEAISIDLIEKRKKTAELKVLMQLAHTQREIDIASEFFDCIDNFDEGTNLVEVYTTWFLNNKTEENPDRMECLDPNSSRESTPKRFSSSDAESMASSSKKSRNVSESTPESRLNSVVIDPHPDLECQEDTPIVRIFTTHCQKMAKMIDLLSIKQKISMLAIDLGFDFQVRQGVCYRLAVRIQSSNRIGKTGFYAVLCKYYNLECQRDSRQTFFTSFERGSNDSYPYLMVMTDGRVRFTRNQLYLMNLRLTYPRSERGRLSNELMNTTDKIYINGLDNMTSIKTLKVSP